MFKPGDRIVYTDYISRGDGTKHPAEFFTGTIIGLNDGNIQIIFDDYKADSNNKTDIYEYGSRDYSKIITVEEYNSPLFKALNEAD